MRKIAKTAIVILLLVSSIGAWAYFLEYRPYLKKMARLAEYERATEMRIAQSREKVKQRLAKKAEEEKARAVARELQKKLELATVGKGEGVEHAFIRQLANDTAIMDGVKVKVGQKEYNLEFPGGDDMAVKKWANRTAHLLAIATGYVDIRTGRQIGIKKPGEVALLMDVDSGEKKLAIDFYEKRSKSIPDEFSYVNAGIRVEAKFDQQATFGADVKNGISSYEYVWTPVKIKKHKKHKK